ncbi:permease prefix domain 1-containing protein [Paenibacillus sp. CC-CFT747]|nr:permease prefix domain 1-containing protein [Paenibacillus sp. CC-CFT747]
MGAVNYIAHMHLNRLYRKGEDIPAYVAQLALSEEDKQELQNYLEDYAEDLRSQGRTQEEAAREAVSQFRVQELLSLSKNSLLFELHAHYYLLGWSLTAVAAFAGLALIGWMTFPHSLLLLLAETILAAYGFGMAFLFVLYKALDALLYRKLKEHLSD